MIRPKRGVTRNDQVTNQFVSCSVRVVIIILKMDWNTDGMC